ncbi:arginine-tRNA-protein transferase [Gilbertella persicaria]|nr:arginine-tRNA-protein transferase [Gilbertella persicaria]KAI8079689.1 arginine-tRNA-protein transferase [Gilbertella persicaria]
MQSLGVSVVSITGDSQHNCGYCKGKDTSISFGIWAHSMTCTDYQDLIDRGWRRSGKYLYKPDLEKSCCPQYTIRLDASRFNTTKSQKKIITKFNKYIKGTWDPKRTDKDVPKGKQEQVSKPDNYVQIKSLRDYIHESEVTENSKYNFKVELEPSSFTQEKFELYAKYQKSIHHDKEEDISKSGFKRFLIDSPLKPEKNMFGSFHQKYILDGKLVALAVIDILPKCVSSVYFLYDPDYSFLSLGKYSAFREISLVQEYHDKMDSLQYYYMGFYIHTCPKMNYKGQYAPSDLLDPIDYTWHPIEDFRKEFEQQSFVTFVKETRNYPAGWADPSTITKQALEKVLVLLGQDRVAPVNYLVKFDSPAFKKIIVDYVCAVGLKMAQKMIIC